MNIFLLLLLLQGTPEAAEPGIKLETPSTSGRQEGSITAAVVSSGEPTAATTAAGTAPGSVDAGEGPAAKRAKHTDIAEADGNTVPVVTSSAPLAPTPVPTPAAAGPSDDQGGSSVDKKPQHQAHHAESSNYQAAALLICNSRDLLMSLAQLLSIVSLMCQVSLQLHCAIFA